MPKSPLKSKTIWFNLLTLASVAVASVSDHSIITDNPMLVGAVAIFTALVNVGLRVVTKDPIA